MDGFRTKDKTWMILGKCTKGALTCYDASKVSKSVAEGGFVLKQSTFLCCNFDVVHDVAVVKL